MKIFTIILLLLSFNSSAQESVFSPSWDGFRKLFDPSSHSQPLNDKYEFLKKKKPNGKGVYTVNCFLPNGTIYLENLQVDVVKTGFVTYDLLSVNKKFYKVPVGSCFVMEN